MTNHGSPAPRPPSLTARPATEGELVAAALGGDKAAFQRLTDPYVRELHLHCYRMLGSLHDAEDVMQETLMRAWRHLRTFRSKSTLRAWLYRIATNACLTARSRERRRPEAWGTVVPVPEGNARDVEVVPLEPYPDALLDRAGAGAGNPAVRYDLAESVQLAFLGAIQLLPPRQRAVLLLREVPGWSAAEVAELLETTATAVNAMLQRARATLQRQRAAGRLQQEHVGLADDAERELLRRFVDACRAVDIESLVGLLSEGALLTMPPAPMAYRGPAAIGNFFATVPAGGALDRIRLVPTRANRRPALAAYLLNNATGRYEAYGIMVFACAAEGIAAITGFSDATLLPRFGLPPYLED